MAEKNKNPEVRFAGFTDDWEQHELGEVLTERKILQKISDDAPILAFASGQGVIDRSERKSNNRDHLTLDQTNKIYKLTEYNDIVYNPSNLKYGAIDRNKHGRGVISPIYVTFTTEEEPSFIELIVKSEKFKLRALQYEEGTVVKRQSVKPENLLSLDVKISPSRDEQKKIGTLFKQLDNLITRHQRKYDKLVTIKKSMLEKIFPKNGADVPEIRFKGFSEAWEERELGELGEVITGSTPSTQEQLYYSNDGIPWVTPTDISENITFRTAKHLTEEGQKVARVVPKNSILVTSIASIGKNTMLGTTGSFNQQINGLIPKEKENYPYFLFTESALWSAKMKRSAAAGTMQIVNKSEFSALKTNVPTLAEQTKIGNFFKHLDNLITLHQQELEKLKNIKKACFEKIFV